MSAAEQLSCERKGGGEGGATCSRKVFSLSGTSSAVVLRTSVMEPQETVSRGLDDCHRPHKTPQSITPHMTNNAADMILSL